MDYKKLKRSKLRVLVSAYACEPYKGSEPGVGWNWSKQIARFAEVWVITRKNNKTIIQRAIENEKISNLHFIYYDIPKFFGFWKMKTRHLYLYYCLWQFGAFLKVLMIHRNIKFDIVHHITLGNVLLPTLMPFLNIKYIWGPIGGAEKLAIALKGNVDIHFYLKEKIRNLLINSLKYNLLFKNNIKKAHIILAKTNNTAQIIPHSNRVKILVVNDAAADLYNTYMPKKQKSFVQIITVGSLDMWRGYELLINAISKIKNNINNTRLFILGGGSSRNKLEKMIGRLELNRYITLTGHISHDDYCRYMLNSDIFINLNLKEGGVTTMFDALSYGLPIICLDKPGTSDIVDNACGIKIIPVNSEQIINDLVAALLKLIINTKTRINMGKEGRKKAESYYTWDKKGVFIKKVYEDVLGSKIA